MFLTPQAQNHNFRTKKKEPAPYQESIEFVTLNELKSLEKKNKNKNIGMSDSESDIDDISTEEHSNTEASNTEATNDNEMNCFYDYDDDMPDEIHQVLEEDETHWERGEAEESFEDLEPRNKPDVKKQNKKKKNVMFKLKDEQLDENW